VRGRRGWLLGIGVLALVQVGLLVVWQRVDQDRRAAGLPVSGEARSEPGHEFEVERADGSRVAVSARSDRFQIVHFWATWCAPCRRELPTLLALAHRERARLRVWMVSTDHDWRTIAGFFRGDIPAEVVRDRGAGHRAYGVTTLPDSYLHDRDGRIVARFAGAQDWGAEAMRRVLDEHLRDR